MHLVDWLIALSNKCTCTMFLKKHIANASVISFLLHIQEFFLVEYHRMLVLIANYCQSQNTFR